MDSLERSVRLTRRTATVTTSAPEAAWQRAISGKLLYLPVPTNRREWKVRPAMVRVSISPILILGCAGWLLPHGAVEIPAILLGGQAGLVLASALIGWGERARRTERLRAVAHDLLAIALGAAVLLVWAGIDRK